MAAGDIYYQNAALHLNFVTNLMLFDLFWGVQDINNNIAAVGGNHLQYGHKCLGLLFRNELPAGLPAMVYP